MPRLSISCRRGLPPDCLDTVTAAGDVMRIGRRTAKGVAAYDLVG